MKRISVKSSIAGLSSLICLASIFSCPAGAAPMAAAEPVPDGARAIEASRIVAFGDSVTLGARRGVAADETFAALTAALLEPDFPEVRVINAGIGGNSVRHAWTRVYRDVVAEQPAFCTLMFGINDSFVDEGRDRPRIGIEEYEGKLRGFIRLLRYHGIEPVLMTPNPMTVSDRATATARHASREPYREKGMNFLLEEYAQKMREIAREKDLPLIDVYALFYEKGGDDEGVDKLLTDGMHPNPEGHRLIAEALAGFLRDALEGRAGRPLPSTRAAENMEEARARLASLREWETFADWRAVVLPSEATPAWVTPASHDSTMSSLENGVMRFSNLPEGENRFQSMTRSFTGESKAVSLYYEARISADSEGSPYFSLSNHETRIWTWLTPGALIVSRFDREMDRLEIPVNGEDFNSYRVVMAGLDLHVFINDMEEPALVAPGWLVPGEPGGHAQLAITAREKPVETWWRRIRLDFAR